MGNSAGLSPARCQPQESFRFHDGAQRDWWFNPIDNYAYESKNEERCHQRVIVPINTLLDNFSVEGAMQPNRIFIKDGPEAKYVRETYMPNGNGVYGGVHLIIYDADKNNTYTPGLDTVELVLSGFDEGATEAESRNSKQSGVKMTTYSYDAAKNNFYISPYAEYKWVPDGHGSGTIERVPLQQPKVHKKGTFKN